MALKMKILLALVTLALLPTLIIAFISVNTAFEALTEEKFSQLESLREVKRASVNKYLETMLNQVEALSENKSIITSMSELKVAFNNFANELNQTSDAAVSLKNDLRTYYNSYFMPKLKAKSPDTPITAESLVSNIALNGLMLQKEYIISNPNPVGEKHLLDDITPSAYDRAHKNIHPFLRSYLERFRFYDIFLIDAESGNIVYSVFKEVDFATSLLDGPYSDSGLAEVFKLT